MKVRFIFFQEMKGKSHEQSGDHLENSLSKIGYTLNAKVGQKENFLLYFLLPSITYHENSTINFF
jgi:hypothetical protein